MDLQGFVSLLLGFPTSIFFIPLTVLFVIMLVDMVCNVFETFTADLDLFDLDDIPGSGILLPPVLSKVPLAVALFVSFFFATILSFYYQEWTVRFSDLTVWFVVDIISIPVTAYLALFISAWVLKPLTPLFSKHNFAEVNYIGLKARVHSSTINQDIGEIMVKHRGNEYLLDAIINQKTPVHYGDEVIIVSKDKASNRYIVAVSS